MRVVAGRLRGRVLKAPPGDATRPTGARVKEALFSILGDVASSRVLDLYAGSGALGIEALSRGAATAVFVEAARPALSVLRDNLTKLDLLSSCQVFAVRLEAARPLLLSAREQPFDLVLCDPPWRDAHAALEQLQALASLGIFSPTARIVLEHSAKEPMSAAAARSETETETSRRLVVTDERRWGDTAITLFSLNSG